MDGFFDDACPPGVSADTSCRATGLWMEECVGAYPSPAQDSRIEAPERRVLYVGAQGGGVHLRAGRLTVRSRDGAVLLDVAAGVVGRIVVFGGVGVSAAVRSWAMTRGADVVFASRRGGYLGSLVGGASAARTERLRAQVLMMDAAHRIPMCRALVAGKLTKQAVVLQRFGRPEHAATVAPAVARIRQLRRMLDDATSVSEIMGLEGAGAACYLPVLGGLFPEGMRFDHRSRRPPLDLANSALSFLYTVLLGECVTALYACGLDPAFGVLHSDSNRRPSLALDLLEDLRPLIVDQTVIAAARRRELRPEHARSEEGRTGLYLTRAGRQGLLDAYERRMLTRTAGAIPGFSGTLRRHVYRQAQRLAGAIMNPDLPWTGMFWR